MALPPKSDEDNAPAENAETPKKRTRTRLYRAKSTKAAKASAVSDAGDSAPAPEPAPAPVEAPAPAPAPAPEPVATSTPSSAPEAAPADQSGDAPASAPAGSDGGDGGDQFQQQGHPGGGGKWNRWRDKKGRGGGGGGGGKWNKHGGGAPSPKYPPQPPPPKGEAILGELPDHARFRDLDALDKVADEIVGKAEPIWLYELYALGHAELLASAKKLDAPIGGVPTRRQLLALVFAQAAEQKIPLYDRGWLDVTDPGYGFVVHADVNYRLYPEDAYFPAHLIRKYGLKRGLEIEVQVQAPLANERCPAVVRVRSVMNGKPEDVAKVKPFEELTPYYPLKRIWLEAAEQKDMSMRMVDIITPIGFGQRGLIVAPPRTGKTVLMQNMANSIAENSPDAKLLILLIDERPEEVTDFRRHCKGEVISSTFDETPESHVHCAEMVIEKARRLVERGEHVIILLDSITRLARAYNALAGNSGKIMSGGLEANALQKPKRFFGSARNIEGGGSLTILGTALVDTGSRMDEIIFEEFKGTGNMELHLDRDLVNKRIFPALNVDKSGTRKEELIYHPDELARIYALRRAMQGVPAADSVDMLIQRLKKTKTNAEFLLSLNR